MGTVELLIVSRGLFSREVRQARSPEAFSAVVGRTSHSLTNETKKKKKNHRRQRNASSTHATPGNAVDRRARGTKRVLSGRSERVPGIYSTTRPGPAGAIDSVRRNRVSR